MCNEDSEYVAICLRYSAEETFIDSFLVSEKAKETLKNRMEEPCILFDIRSLGIGKKWISYIGQKHTAEDEVQELSGEDKKFLLYWIVCFSMKKKNFFGQEILRYYKDLDAKAVYEKLFHYINDNGFDFHISQIKHLADINAWKDNVNKMLQLYLTVKQFLLKNACRVVIAHIRIKAFLFGKLFSNRTLTELSKQGYEIISSRLSTAGNQMHKLKKDGEVYLAKGREDFAGVSFENEKMIQANLKPAGNDSSFVVASDLLSESIVYPYVNGRTLDQIKSKDEYSIEKLGDFLVNVVETLYQKRIIHRDLRPNNIMVIDGKTESYGLIDFGCAIMNHHDIWEKKSFMNGFRKERVCDEYKLSQEIVDDAASALAIYLKYGGDYNDQISRILKSRIGRFTYRQ